MEQTPYRCPSCQVGLAQRRHDPGTSWVCDACGGAAITMPVIRQHAAPGLANAIWNEARGARMESARRCPGCSRNLRSFEVEDPAGGTELDGCIACQFFWFDASELVRLDIVMKAPAGTDVSRALADLRLEELRQKRKAEATVETVDTLTELLWLLWRWTK